MFTNLPSVRKTLQKEIIKKKKENEPTWLHIYFSLISRVSIFFPNDVFQDQLVLP